MKQLELDDFDMGSGFAPSDEGAKSEPPAGRRAPTAKMRRAFDDLDPVIYAEKRWRRHRRQRFVRFLRKVAGLCASCGEKLSRDNDGVTCPRCLGVDKAYKVGAKETVTIARFVDEFGRPMRLKGTPKMLPVIGPRYDGSDPDWPACENLSACMTELVLACGAKEAPGASCPEGCGSRHGP
jgi:hypothetical protein